MTDNEIIASYRKDGEKHWVGKLYERYAHLVLGLCCKYLGDKALAEDATCDIFMSLYDKLGKHQVDNFRGWLYTTARNHCLMQIRSSKNGKHVGFNGHEPIADEGKLEELRLREVRLELLESKIPELKEDQGRCVRLFYLKKKSYAEIADTTNIEIKKVKSHIQNGKRNLKILLEQHTEFNGNE